tara:strand:+ start:385 stop:663 length:279 start_codon:yes stop_codon:yes gene_type:complete
MQTNYSGDTSEVSELSAQIHKFQHESEQLKKDYTQTMIERNSFLLQKESLQDEVLKLTMENAELKDMVSDLGGDYTSDDNQMTLDFKPTSED